MVQGTATVHSSAEETLRYTREAARLRGVPEGDLPTEPRKDAVLHQGDASTIQVMGLLSRLVIPGKQAQASGRPRLI